MPFSSFQTFFLASGPNVMSTISSGGIARSGSAMAATVILLIPPVVLYMVTQGSVMQTMGSAGIKE